MIPRLAGTRTSRRYTGGVPAARTRRTGTTPRTTALRESADSKTLTLDHDLDEASTHEHQPHQDNHTTPVTHKLNCPTALTWGQQRAQLLGRRLMAVPLVVLPMARRLQRQWERATIALVVTVRRVDPDRELLRGYGPHRNDMHDRPHPAQQTRRQALRRQPTGPASTSPHHFELSAADGTTFA